MCEEEDDDGKRAFSSHSPAVDFFSQARKALSDRSPFEPEEALARVPTLPVAVSLFLSRNSSDSRKKHRKVQGESPATPMKKKAVAKGAGPRNIWAETEEYFRPVTLSDVEFLHSALQGTDLDFCFEIPPLSSGNVAVEVVKEGERQDWQQQQQEEERQEEQLQEMEIDIVEPASEVVAVPEEREEVTSVPSLSTLSVGLGWLLGSKHKVLLTTERPSKKRKLLGAEAGLEKLVAVGPDTGGDSNSGALCDVCCLRDTGNGLNILLECSSCSVFVHKNCYGVTEVPEDNWVCSWCKRENGSVVERPCVLCPRAGGALKPVGRDYSGGSTFAHLYCCQWMPEVYVENTETMGPIMNIDGIKETRKRLICHICKLKNGVCIRCSHGTCRTSFHPICAREAKQRMEIWGKAGYDSVELRAFCSKHSVSEDFVGAQLSQNLVPVTVSGDSSDPKLLPVALSVNRLPKLNLGCKNNDKFQVTNCDNIDESTMSTISVQSQMVEFQDDLISEAPGSAARNCIGDFNSSNSSNILMMLKKLVDQRKISVTNVASEIGVSSSSLAEALKGENTSFPSEWMPKVVKWLRNAAHLATSVKWLNHQNGDGLKSSIRPLPLRRKIISGIRVLKDNNMVVDSSDEKLMQMNGGSGLLLHETADKPFDRTEDVTSNNAAKELIATNRDVCVDTLDTTWKNVDPSREQFAHSSPDSLHPGTKVQPQSVGKKLHVCKPENIKSDGSDDAVLKIMNASPRDTSDKNDQAASAANIHPLITRRLLQTDNCLFAKQKSRISENDGQVESMMSLCTSKMGHCRVNYDKDCAISRLGDQLTEAKRTGTLEYSPDDEVEGEILYLQNKLIDNAIANKHRCENLIFRVVTNLPHELESLRKQRWDAVLVSQFLHQVREVKKLGRKEKRHKEAQAVLAVAAAAAAASSRVSSLRKDVHDDIVSASEEVNVDDGRAGLRSQSLPRTKNALSKLKVLGLSSKQAENSKDKSCDVCGRGETMLNSILVCSNCKVAVHPGCYHNLKNPIGPWYCEPCEEMMIIQSRDSMAQLVTSCERLCGLCGCTFGAFRKSSDGQWVHAFCSEWMLPTFRSRQSYSVEGMDSLVREREDLCYICQRKVGVCVKCSYGHCQASFHPICGRKAGLYMKKFGRSKSQHKVYCEKHSLEQKEKEATSQYGTEVLGRLKQIRVELEKLRLLCERIIKREKVKKELVLSSHDILASKRDFIAFSVLVHSLFPPPDVSSESVTTSLKGHPEDKSCSEGIHQSDDVTVDSTVSSKRHIGYPQQMEIDRRTDDSSTSQRQYTRKTSLRIPSSGKQLLHGPFSAPSKNLGDDEDKKSKARKHLETFQKELLMTSDQASMQNQRLPKGFAYVPIGCLSKDKHEPDG